MSNPSKQRGTAWETALVRYLREQCLDADRLRQTGKNDEGDIVLRLPRMGGQEGFRTEHMILEAKATSRLNLAGWVAEAELEAGNFADHRPGIKVPGFVVAFKRRQHSTGKSYIITTLDEWLRQIA